VSATGQFRRIGPFGNNRVRGCPLGDPQWLDAVGDVQADRGMAGLQAPESLCSIKLWGFFERHRTIGTLIPAS
jgi:hypothetical protein